jgi:hypothetical protein
MPQDMGLRVIIEWPFMIMAGIAALIGLAIWWRDRRR